MKKERIENKEGILGLLIGAALAATAVAVISIIPGTRQAFTDRPLAYLGIATATIVPCVTVGTGVTIAKKHCRTLAKTCILVISIVLATLLHAFFAVNLIAPSVMMRTPKQHVSLWDSKSHQCYRPFSVESGKDTLKGAERKGEALTLLIYGGSGNDFSRFFTEMLKDDAFTETRILMLDYPGVGESEGFAAESALLESGLLLFDYAKEHYPNDPIVLIGYSLGTGVATYVSSMRDPEGLVLVAPYYEATDFYTRHDSLLYHICRAISIQRFSVYEWAEDTTVSPLLISSRTDTVTPQEGADRLLQHFPNGGTLVSHDLCSHGDYWDQELTYEWIEQYLKEHDLID